MIYHTNVQIKVKTEVFNLHYHVIYMNIYHIHSTIPAMSFKTEFV